MMRAAALLPLMLLSCAVTRELPPSALVVSLSRSGDEIVLQLRNASDEVLCLPDTFYVRGELGNPEAQVRGFAVWVRAMMYNGTQKLPYNEYAVSIHVAEIVVDDYGFTRLYPDRKIHYRLGNDFRFSSDRRPEYAEVFANVDYTPWWGDDVGGCTPWKGKAFTDTLIYRF